MPALQPNRKELQQGFSLFEVLITIVVISIGLLGLAGLQFAGLQAANNAQEHTLATLLAQDIQERIKANPAADYAPSGTPLLITSGGTATSADDCTSIDCALATQMLNFDKRRWYYMINSGGDDGLDNTPMLANARIQVERCTTTTPNPFKITIQWNGSNDASDPCTPGTTDPTTPNTLTVRFVP